VPDAITLCRLADLVQRFLAGVPGAARARCESIPDLPARLQALIREARDAWPGIHVPEEELAGRMGRAVGEGGDDATLEALHVGDLHLAVACERRDPAALAALEGAVLPAVVRTRRGPLPDEVVQQLREKVIVQGKIAEYGGRGALRQWLRMVGTRLWLDESGKPPREVDLDDAPGALDALLSSSPELKLVRAEARALLRRAVIQSFTRLAPRERTLLRLHHLSGVPHGKLAGMMGAPRSTVAYWLSQARDALLTGAREWLQRERDVGPEELESLLRAAGSRLDLTLADVLESQPGPGSTP